jgi:hypothetical protein
VLKDRLEKTFGESLHSIEFIFIQWKYGNNTVRTNIIKNRSQNIIKQFTQPEYEIYAEVY